METLARLASEFDVPAAVRARATDVATAVFEVKRGTGCNPAGIAAACVYLAAREHDVPLLQRAVAEAAGVTDVTLRARMNDAAAIGAIES